MLTNRATLRRLTTAAALLIGLLASLQIAAPATAEALPTIRLVQHADGHLEIVTGAQFTASSPGQTVLATETDVLLATTGVVQDSLDASTGLVSDALRHDQWNLDEVQAETVWTRATGAGQIIAIVDTGVDGAHLDLIDRLVPGYSATGADELVDGHGHGTHVSGTAAASVGDGYGVAGLAPEAAIMPIQVTDSNGMAYASDVAEGLIWAVDNGATVANLSLAGTHESVVLNGAIDHAVANGVVVVVAAGNENGRGNPAMYPASHPDVIAVGAMRDASSRSAFSSTGDWLDLAAPGSSILSTRPDATFGFASGTSMAAPLVAGAVALVRSAAPDLTEREVRTLLADGARDIGDTGWDQQFGHGALDVVGVLEQINEAPATLEDPVGDELSTEPALSRIDGLYSGEGYRRHP